MKIIKNIALATVGVLILVATVLSMLMVLEVVVWEDVANSMVRLAMIGGVVIVSSLAFSWLMSLR